MITALPLQQFKVAVTLGVFKDMDVIHCEADGAIAITWDDKTVTPYAMLAGDDRIITEAYSVEVTSGSFTLAEDTDEIRL